MIDFAHVGIQKTGSTWLQTGLFAHHPELDVIGGNITARAAKQLVTALYETPPDAFDRQVWQRDFEREAARLQREENSFQGDKLRGFSSEQLSGYIFDQPTGLRVAERLHALFGAIKIILVLRNPLTFIPSAYTQGVKSGGITPSYRNFLGDPAMRKKIAARIDYHQLIYTYTETFGTHNLLVLPYELLRDDAAHFLRHITDFLDVAPFDTAAIKDKPVKNQRISLTMLAVLRRLNQVDHLIHRMTGRQKLRLLNRATRRLLGVHSRAAWLKNITRTYA